MDDALACLYSCYEVELSEGRQVKFAKDVPHLGPKGPLLTISQSSSHTATGGLGQDDSMYQGSRTTFLPFPPASTTSQKHEAVSCLFCLYQDTESLAVPFSQDIQNSLLFAYPSK